MTDTIDVKHNSAAQRFEVIIDGHLAEADYEMRGGKIVFTHTKVPEALSGRGIANQLAIAALGYARAEKLPVVAECAFIASYIKRHDEYADLIG
ncbi:MAG: acetyltransferase [Acidobacteria bacterium]|jgi:predicted GNAT family acetyltransferase|nr:acetyltransferase [Acidobacteriota bacterium]